MSQENLELDLATGARDFVNRLTRNNTFTKATLKEMCKSELEIAKQQVSPHEIFLNYAQGALLFVISLDAKEDWTYIKLSDLAALRYKRAQESFLNNL